mmetsp:Transcript_16603/g.24763  ORF Transcript_16603/g.24763 Transcript_16603/m.24763 type:complete len:268 (+) Transcript_16603:1265-2068(+)
MVLDRVVVVLEMDPMVMVMMKNVVVAVNAKETKLVQALVMMKQPERQLLQHSLKPKPRQLQNVRPVSKLSVKHANLLLVLYVKLKNAARQKMNNVACCKSNWPLPRGPALKLKNLPVNMLLPWPPPKMRLKKIVSLQKKPAVVLKKKRVVVPKKRHVSVPRKKHVKLKKHVKRPKRKHVVKCWLLKNHVEKLKRKRHDADERPRQTRLATLLVMMMMKMMCERKKTNVFCLNLHKSWLNCGSQKATSVWRLHSTVFLCLHRQCATAS